MTKIFTIVVILFLSFTSIYAETVTSEPLEIWSEDQSSNSNFNDTASTLDSEEIKQDSVPIISQGEIDYSDTSTIYLTDVDALIKLINSNNIIITSDFGKYNTNNFDTIFSKNVIIHYSDNKITGEYLDFSIKRNSMIISNNVIYTNSDNILKADVIEMNIETKDTKIFMYKNDKKVNIKSK